MNIGEEMNLKSTSIGEKFVKKCAKKDITHPQNL